MLSLLRKLVGRVRVTRDRRERWVEPSNAITRAVLDPGVRTTSREESLDDRVRASHPIPERRRTTAAAPPPPPPSRSEPAAAREEQEASPVEQGKKRGRAA